jgi:hypothetical protein
MKTEGRRGKEVGVASVEWRVSSGDCGLGEGNRLPKQRRAKYPFVTGRLDKILIEDVQYDVRQPFDVTWDGALPI